MFLTDAETLIDLAATLQQAGVTTLASQLPTINTRSHARGVADLVNALLLRGYSVAQITAWDAAYAAPLERDMSLFNALSLAWVRTQVGTDFIKVFDRREDLKTMPVITGGLFVKPDGPVGIPGAGAYQTSGDMFVEDDLDPRRGIETRW